MGLSGWPPGTCAGSFGFSRSISAVGVHGVDKGGELGRRHRAGLHDADVAEHERARGVLAHAVARERGGVLVEGALAAEALIKSVKSKFAGAMLGILKVTQNNAAHRWRNVP